MVLLIGRSPPISSCATMLYRVPLGTLGIGAPPGRPRPRAPRRHSSRSRRAQPPAAAIRPRCLPRSRLRLPLPLPLRAAAAHADPRALWAGPAGSGAGAQEHVTPVN